MAIKAEQNMLAGIDLSAGLTQQQAEQIYQHGKEAVIFALLTLSKLAVEQRQNNLPAAIAADSSTPSAQKAVFVKPNASFTKRHKRPGQKHGYKGCRRELPTRIDRTAEHRVKSCPECGCTDLQQRDTKRERFICERIEKRLKLILGHRWSNNEARRLIKRLVRQKL